MKTLSPEALPPLAKHEMQRLVHELQVHQIELEMQNAELRQARDEAETAREKYTELYDFAPVGYFTLDRDGIIRAVNLSGAGLLGVDRFRLLGRRFGQFVVATDRLAFTAFLQSVFTRRGKEECEVTILKEGTLPRIVQIEAMAAASEEEVFAAARDVTDHNRAEEQIKHLNEELERRVRERTVELEQRNRELEGFCHAISHEIRAPIARLEGFGTMLLEIAGESGDAQIVHCARRIGTASNRLRGVIDSLLTMNRVSRAEMHLQNLNLSDLAMQIVSELLKNCGKRSLHISIAPDVTATGDREMLEICMRNLLENAIKHSSKTPDASVEFGQRIIDGERVFFVKDNGIGFDAKFAANIFQPFSRMHNENEFEGMGIGLATVQLIIEKHKGGIWIEAKPGEGATFFFTLQGSA
jgi:PAS domain S-box-containing protein